jgi:hypothetical protein
VAAKAELASSAVAAEQLQCLPVAVQLRETGNKKSTGGGVCVIERDHFIGAVGLPQQSARGTGAVGREMRCIRSGRPSDRQMGGPAALLGFQAADCFDRYRSTVVSERAL